MEDLASALGNLLDIRAASALLSPAVTSVSGFGVGGAPAYRWQTRFSRALSDSENGRSTRMSLSGQSSKLA
jgi:hypothetical protein